MFFSNAALVLATLTVDLAAAVPLKHAHFHAKKGTSSSAIEANLAERSTSVLTSVGESILADAQIALPGINDVTDNGGVWIGTGNPNDYITDFSNQSGEELVLVIWNSATGYESSFLVNPAVPAALVTASIAPGDSLSVSFAPGVSGAFAAVYASSTRNGVGQIYETWGEYTFNPTGVLDVSRLVNMNGHNMEIVVPTPEADYSGGCTSNMDDMCVFMCTDPSVDTCFDTGVELVGCTSQPGAQSGNLYGAPEGGCGGLTPNVPVMVTFLPGTA